MFQKYILNDQGEPVEVRNLMEWAMSCDGNRENWAVKQEVIEGIEISTVFLGINHNFRKGPPVVWETMTFGPKGEPLAYACDRCAGGREQAEAMHEAMVGVVRAELASRAEALAMVGDLVVA